MSVKPRNNSVIEIAIQMGFRCMYLLCILLAVDEHLLRSTTAFLFRCSADLGLLFEATHLATNPTVTFVVLAGTSCIQTLLDTVSSDQL